MTGLMGALQLCADKDARRPFPEKAEMGLVCREHSIAAGLVMRAVGDRMVVSPPLILSHEEADMLVERARIALDRTEGRRAEPRPDLGAVTLRARTGRGVRTAVRRDTVGSAASMGRQLVLEHPARARLGHADAHGGSEQFLPWLVTRPRSPARWSRRGGRRPAPRRP